MAEPGGAKRSALSGVADGLADAVGVQAAVLARHGYGALLLDTRGHGLSGGHAMEIGWWGDRDIAAAVSFLDRQPGIHAGKIAVVGESMGGEQALAAMRADRGSAAWWPKVPPASSQLTTAGSPMGSMVP